MKSTLASAKLTLGALATVEKITLDFPQMPADARAKEANNFLAKLKAKSVAPPKYLAEVFAGLAKNEGMPEFATVTKKE
eukprot:3207662-Lingulodinium_polyedra.AAC.1